MALFQGVRLPHVSVWTSPLFVDLIAGHRTPVPALRSIRVLRRIVVTRGSGAIGCGPARLFRCESGTRFRQIGDRSLRNFGTKTGRCGVGIGNTAVNFLLAGMFHHAARFRRRGRRCSRGGWNVTPRPSRFVTSRISRIQATSVQRTLLTTTEPEVVFLEEGGKIQSLRFTSVVACVRLSLRKITDRLSGVPT